MQYYCQCGREFNSPASLGGHQSACKDHLIFIGKYDSWLKMNDRRGKKVSQTYAKKRELKALEAQMLWEAENHVCENCGTIMKTKFGSGRFCSKTCANSHPKSIESRVTLSNKCTGNNLSKEDFERKLLSKPQKDKICEICGKQFSAAGLRVHSTKCKRANNIPVYAKINHIELDITVEELAKYKSEVTTCEICGRSVEEAVKSKHVNIKTLCVDHDHATNHFRGLLCQSCNRQLGWYENYRQQVASYLSKDSI